MIREAIAVSGMPEEIRNYIEVNEFEKGASMIYKKGHLKRKQ